MVANVTAGFSRQPQDLSEHEKLVRELLPADVAEAYLELTHTGARVTHGADPIDQELLNRQLAYVQPDLDGPLIRAVDPLIAVTGLLTQVHHELTKQHGRLLQGYVAAAEMHQLQLHDRRTEHVPSVLAQVITEPDELAARWTTSIQTVQCTYRSIVTGEGPAPVLPAPINAQCNTMQYRQLCTPEYLAEPGVQTALDAGVEVRTVRELPTRMVIVDDHFALVGLAAGGSTGALLVRSSELVAALTQYYDQLWESATPVTQTQTKGLGGTEREVLRLLVHGLKDEAIARHLQISVRTVRRHIAAIMEFVDAPTRFAAGAAAHRLGLLG
ncbi:LuxR family transcriptional regulator [Kribbella antibiotica]|uniref:LuxR family transcriptional regulator n=1 Tax=Kribbella antibiotica TaxID=190195 RepID=A0A4V2YQC7_9ACTN|nr:LuxR C-terminal-related transcriptional regulator [Kribbella antibiotica]TDD61377.1 LuxR family transcriptional regulator [Kribbella antibiotica]